MSVTTYVPYLTALVAAAQANAPLVALCAVYDGQPITSSPKDYLALGYQETNDDVHVGGQSGWRAMSRTLEGEYTIPCQVSCTSGSSDHVATRLAAQAIVDAFWAVLLPAGTRGNATALGVTNVIGARLDGHEVRVRKDPSVGTSVDWLFNVVVSEYVVSS